VRIVDRSSADLLYSSLDLISVIHGPTSSTLGHATSGCPSEAAAHLYTFGLVHSFMQLCDSSTKFAGRVPEQQFIRNFLTEFIQLRSVSEVTRPVLYSSGSPGCMKTALVNSILATSDAELLANNITLVSVNCMALTVMVSRPYGTD
jgi:hypothetical protein